MTQPCSLQILNIEEREREAVKWVRKNDPCYRNDRNEDIWYVAQVSYLLEYTISCRWPAITPYAWRTLLLFLIASSLKRTRPIKRRKSTWRIRNATVTPTSSNILSRWHLETTTPSFPRTRVCNEIKHSDSVGAHGRQGSRPSPNTRVGFPLNVCCGHLLNVE